MLRPRRVVELGVRFRRRQFQETTVDRPTQANRINRYPVDGGGLYALIPIAGADIAIFAAIAQYHDCAARKRRPVGDLDAEECRIVERGLTAIRQAVDGPQQPIPIRCVIDHQRYLRAEGNNGHRVVRAQGVDVLPGRFFRLPQRSIGHTAAGINHQDSGKGQIVVCDVFHARHSCQARQIATDRDVVDAQARDELTAGIENTGVDGNI